MSILDPKHQVSLDLLLEVKQIPGAEEPPCAAGRLIVRRAEGRVLIEKVVVHPKGDAPDAVDPILEPVQRFHESPQQPEKRTLVNIVRQEIGLDARRAGGRGDAFVAGLCRAPSLLLAFCRLFWISRLGILYLLLAGGRFIHLFLGRRRAIHFRRLLPQIRLGSHPRQETQNENPRPDRPKAA